MTAGVVHVTNLSPRGSECHPYGAVYDVERAAFCAELAMVGVGTFHHIILQTKKHQFDEHLSYLVTNLLTPPPDIPRGRQPYAVNVYLGETIWASKAPRKAGIRDGKDFTFATRQNLGYHDNASSGSSSRAGVRLLGAEFDQGDVSKAGGWLALTPGGGVTRLVL
jgi:hypothetical protein